MTPPAPPAPNGTIALSVNVPPAPAGTKHPLYVSPGTIGMTITDSSAAGTATYQQPCVNSVCSYQFGTAPGAHTLTVKLTEGSDPLSIGTTTTTVASSQTDTVTLTFNPVVASMHVQYVSSAPGVAADIPVKIIALDPAGYTIIGSDSFIDASGAPIHMALSDTDQSGHSVLGSGTIAGPADAITLHYDGTPHATAILKGTATGSVLVGNGAFAAIGTDTTSSYAGSGQPIAATVGSDGNLWMTGWASAGFDVVRMTPSGTQSVFNVPSYAAPPPNPGLSVTPGGIASGADGNLWVSVGAGGSENVVRITTAGVTTAFSDSAFKIPRGIAAGPDGNLWVADQLGQLVASVTPSGAITSYPLTNPSEPVFAQSDAFGPDGRLYFVNGATNWIDGFNISTLVRTEYTAPAGVFVVGHLIRGADGNIWFACGSNGGNCIGNITAAGVYNIIPVAVPVDKIALGADGQIWFADQFFGLRWLTASGEIGGYPMTFAPNGGINMVATAANGSFVIETYNGQGIASIHALPF